MQSAGWSASPWDRWAFLMVGRHTTSAARAGSSWNSAAGQDLLLAGFGLWVLVLFRGVQNFLTWKNMWSTPAWLFYGCSVMVFFLFFTINMTPKTNFIISDFWRWLVVHMWVEVTFEDFTTVIVAYLYRKMGIVSKAKAECTTYIAVMLFFLTAVIGVGQVFYWIVEPRGMIPLGSFFSAAQVFHLILFTLDAWKHTQIEELVEQRNRQANSGTSR